MNRLRSFLVFFVLISGSAECKPLLQGLRGNYTISEYIQSSPKAAWKVITDYENHAKWAPDISSANAQRVDAVHLRLVHVYKSGYTFGIPVTAELQVKEQYPFSYVYTLTRASNIESLHGKWSIIPQGSGINLIHSISVKPKVPKILLSHYFSEQEKSLLLWSSILKSKILDASR